MNAGRRLDELMIDVMEWHIGSWSDETDGGYNLYDADDNYVRKWDAPKGWLYDEADPKWRWSPSTDIKAAWDIVQKLRLWIIPFGHADWACADKRSKRLAFENILEMAETAPLAICRAAYEMTKNNELQSNRS